MFTAFILPPYATLSPSRTKPTAPSSSSTSTTSTSRASPTAAAAIAAALLLQTSAPNLAHAETNFTHLASAIQSSSNITLAPSHDRPIIHKLLAQTLQQQQPSHLPSSHLFPQDTFDPISALPLHSIHAQHQRQHANQLQLLQDPLSVNDSTHTNTESELQFPKAKAIARKLVSPEKQHAHSYHSDPHTFHLGLSHKCDTCDAQRSQIVAQIVSSTRMTPNSILPSSPRVNEPFSSTAAQHFTLHNEHLLPHLHHAPNLDVIPRVQEDIQPRTDTLNAGHFVQPHDKHDSSRLRKDIALARDRFLPTSSPHPGPLFDSVVLRSGEGANINDEVGIPTNSRQDRDLSLPQLGQSYALYNTFAHTRPSHDVMRVSLNPQLSQGVSATPSAHDAVSHSPLPGLSQHSFQTTMIPSANAEPFALPSRSDEEHALADEAWQLVNKYFVSPSFNGANWEAERTELTSTSLPSRKATYAALRKAFRKLSDRYTRLLTPSEMNELRRFDVSGVGLLLTTDASGALVVATDPPQGSAAARAGVVRGDVLKAVDGVSVKDEAAFSVSERMQGPDGSDMHVIFRGKEPITLRRSFPRATGSRAVRAKLLDAADGSKLGYIRLSEFRASSREEVAKATEQLVNDGAQWLVVDLRKNGGGVFEGALEIAGLFEGPDVPVAQVEGRSDAPRDVPGREETYKSRLVRGERQVPSDVDLAVLIDHDSASASEVLAGALRDRCRAALVGERSYGKGVIQGVFGLSDGGGVVVTVAEYRTPNGERIQGVGLKPDRERKMGVMEKIARILGIEKVDETTIGIEREQVQEAIKMCRTQSERVS